MDKGKDFFQFIMHNYKKETCQTQHCLFHLCIDASLLGDLELTTQSSLLTTKKKDATG